VRDDEIRTEARRDLGFLQALRQAIPAALDDGSGVKDAFEKYEAGLIAKANGADAKPTDKRYSTSKTKSPKPVRRAPQPAK
jgi:hypothetical protein